MSIHPENPSITGLTSAEAANRLALHGFNELPTQKKRAIWTIMFNVMKEPMLIMLLVAGLIYLFIGDVSDSIMLLASIFFVIGITFYQERKTERALDALKDLSAPRALVIRDGTEKTIMSREVVPGDIVILREGDRVPADAAIIENTNLLLDESLLTGESVPVRKSIWDKISTSTQPGGDDSPFVYSGTMVAQGHALAEVMKTGVETEIGKIGKSLQSITDEETLLKKETGRIIKIFAVVGLSLCLLIVLIYGIARHDWIQGFLSGLTLSMSMLPEEFSVVLVIFLAIGAWRMSRHNVLARKSAAIETLGAATTLCVDKTGTITMNSMRLSVMVANNEIYDLSKNQNQPLPETFHPLLEYARLACQKDPFDPIEKEILAKSIDFLQNTEHIHPDWKIKREYPLSKEILAISEAWEARHGHSLVIATKGAPEAVADLCHFTPAESATLMKQIQSLANMGLRILGVARADFDGPELPTGQHDFKYKFLGLIGFADPVRPSVASAVTECYNAGIRVIMITGDYPGTAQFIAKQIGLNNSESYLTGSDLRNLSSTELAEKIKNVNIFARVMPEQKLTIVNALKTNGEIVAMTGDGVNDAPALKSAHIGIAMGGRGTDVAREASDLVLIDDDFSSIVSGVKMGRRIFDNLKKAIAYIFSVHIPTAGLALIPIIFNLPIVLMPAHIAFLELIIDPACSIVFESEKSEKNIMRHRPRNLRDPLFNRRTFILSLLQGLSLLTAVLAIYLFAFFSGFDENTVRTLAFTTIVLGNLLLIIINLSHTAHFGQILLNKNKSLYIVLANTVTFLTITLTLPLPQKLFRFSSLSFTQFLYCLVAAVISLIWFEIYKIVLIRKNKTF
ncbi:MAG TPA: cation-translocating P-type ATPase [Candidatus Magasanikbacteria bacterium]|nr:cation-translocating P-type ATPase [Candidatus Magasanikbacteria bacterium]